MNRAHGRAHDLARGELAPGSAEALDELAPGRISRSSLLDAPATPILSGLIQREARDAAGVADDAAFAVASAAASSGSPLPTELRARFESALGTELSSVRVHTGAESARASAAVGARAYTLGSDIHFAAGQFDPSSLAGQRLLAHEVAHTVQQRGGAPHRQNKLEVSSPDDALEREADRAADAMVTATPVALGAVGDTGGTVYRQHDPSARLTQGLTLPTLGASASPSGRQLSSSEWTLQGFATGSDALTAEHQQTITQIAQDLNANGLGQNGFVTINGHADSRGTDERNHQLGQQRADRVRSSLTALLTNPQTAHEVRAYSTGEADNERGGDVAEYRQVTVTITRRTTSVHLMDPGELSLRPPQTDRPPPLVIPPGLGELPPSLTPRGPQGPAVPPDLWTLPSAQPPSRNVVDQFIHDLSARLTGALGREQIARAAAEIAERFGGDRGEIERKLNDALVEAGEAGVHRALRAIVEGIAGPPTGAPSSPYGPPTQEIPTTIFQTPPIPIPGS